MLCFTFRHKTRSGTKRKSRIKIDSITKKLTFDKENKANRVKVGLGKDKTRQSKDLAKGKYKAEQGQG